MPGNQRFLAMRMLLAVETSKPQFAEEQARSVWNEYRDTSADINQTFALTLLKLTRGVRRDAVLDDIVEATTRAERLATGTSLAPQASLLRAYAATLRGAVAPEELVEHIEGGRLNEAKVLQLCTPDWDGQTISHLAA
jgi:hypothetical protein